MSLKISLKQLVRSLLALVLISILVLTVFNVNWFYFTPLQYELDTFTYEKMLDTGMYASIIDTTNIIEWLIREPGWAFFLTKLNYYFSSYNIVFFIIPFLIVFCYSIFIYKRSNFIYMFFLLHPIALMFYLNQLRLAFAFCLFYILYIFLNNKKYLYILSFFIFIIHTSFLIFWVVFLYIEFLLSCKKSNNYKFCMTFIGATFLTFLTGPAISFVLGVLGDRRADSYGDSLWQTSLLTSLYCFVFIMFFIFNFYFNKMRRITFEQLCTMFFLAMVVISPVFVGGYPFRFLSAIFPIMLIALYQLNKEFSVYSTAFLVFIGLYIGFFQLNWIKVFG